MGNLLFILLFFKLEDFFQDNEHKKLLSKPSVLFLMFYIKNLSFNGTNGIHVTRLRSSRIGMTVTEKLDWEFCNYILANGTDQHILLDMSDYLLDKRDYLI